MACLYPKSELLVTRRVLSTGAGGIGSRRVVLSARLCLRDPCSSRESELWELIQQLSRKNHPKNSHSRSDKAEKKSDCSAGSWSEESRPVQLELDPAGVFVGQSFPYICLKEKSHME